MLYLFDLDGTLITSYMDTAGRDYDNWQLLPGRREKIAYLVAAGHQIGIITNQGGVAYGFVDEEQVARKLMRIAAGLGFRQIRIQDGASDEDDVRWRTTSNEAPISPRTLPIFVSYGAGERHKPSGAMLDEARREAMPDYIGDDGEFLDVPMLFIGDRPEDLAAALAAGVDFAWAEAFFGEGA